MASDHSISVLKCPSCGAPIEPEKGASTMKCPYCAASIIIPESLRTSSHATLSDATRLAREGKLDEAAKIYSKITGLSYENAMFSVKSMAGIRDEELASDPYRSLSQTNYQTPPLSQPVYTQPTVRVRGGSCLSGIIRLIVLLSILGTAVPVILGALQFKLPFDLPFLSGENPIIPEPFAKEVMSFSPSSLKDPRAIGLDGTGNILVFNYNSSDIQMFNPEGDEIFLMKITESDGDELNNSNMGVSQNGTIYVPGFQGILAFNESGERLREIRDDEHLFIIYSVMVGADDKLYARSDSGIVRFNENGEIDLFISDETLEEISGEYPSTGAMGVDAQGNIYFSGTFNKDVLKFSPTGEFISSFGGDFTSVRHLAFDSYGRIYIVDFSDVKVYDANYNYVDTIDGSFWGVDFDKQNYMYALTTQGDNVLKFEVRAPNAP
jgi:predicted RNA-binding Zn-ribbon protein involved in translation (DUF1610 family)